MVKRRNVSISTAMHLDQTKRGIGRQRHTHSWQALTGYDKLYDWLERVVAGAVIFLSHATEHVVFV